MSIENPTLAHFRSLLTNEIRSTKDYVRKNKLFMQNKANFQKVKFDVNRVLTKNYDRLDTWSIRTKQSQTNPNKAKFEKAKMNVTAALTMEYENMSNWAICENKPNSNPNKPNFKTLPGKDSGRFKQLFLYKKSFLPMAETLGYISSLRI